ncbi:unnamed protein product [Prorocentrum cordatum]|uniref:Uncharacterized protein n=1 Tax=Prorocentrum cordatum TaxID=2364126 RepID=A0ABN9W0D0_9DINO|nr:unnamed protein product [Polarella glacialis]
MPEPPGASSAGCVLGRVRIFLPLEEAGPEAGECMSRWVPVRPFPSGPARASNPRSPSLPPRILRRAHPHTHSARLVTTKAHSSGRRRCLCAKETPAELIRSRWSLEETFAKKRAT